MLVSSKILADFARSDWLLGVAAVFLLGSYSRAETNSAPQAATERGPHLKSQDRWSCVLAGQATKFRYGWREDAGGVVDLEWQLSSGGRAIGRGHAKAKTIADAASGAYFDLPVDIPNVKPGVVLSAEFTVSVRPGDGESLSATRRLEIFSPDPFAGRRETLRRMKIQLFDPSGETARTLDAAKIPYSPLPSMEAWGDSTTGILIVGENLDWINHKSVPAAVIRSAQRGMKVLCLAPSRGELPLYQENSDQRLHPSEVTLSSEDILRRFDGRFDTRQWAGGRRVTSTFRVDSDEHSITVTAEQSPAAWPWVLIRWDDPEANRPSGTLVLCGFGIIKHWRSSPVPRYLLDDILDMLSKPDVSLGKE
jgi:hypothetical protein